MIRYKKIYIGLVLVGCYCLFIANSSLNPRAVPDKNLVVTSFYPMYLHTKTLTKNTTIPVVNLAGTTGMCLHDYQLSTDDAKALSQATLLITSGLEEHDFITQIASREPNLEVVYASLEENPTEREEEHHDEEDHHHEGEAKYHNDETHEHLENTHLWLSTEGAKRQIERIYETLIRHYPEWDDVLSSNYEDYRVAIDALDIAMLPIEKTQKVSMVHDSFVYLTEAVGIETVAMLEEGTYDLPSPRQLQEMIEIMREAKVNLILTEARYTSLPILRTLERETGARLVILDALTEPKSEDFEVNEIPYVARMQWNLEQLEGIGNE